MNPINVHFQPVRVGTFSSPLLSEHAYINTAKFSQVEVVISKTVPLMPSFVGQANGSAHFLSPKKRASSPLGGMTRPFCPTIIFSHFCDFQGEVNLPPFFRPAIRSTKNCRSLVVTNCMRRYFWGEESFRHNSIILKWNQSPFFFCVTWASPKCSSSFALLHISNFNWSRLLISGRILSIENPN